MACATDVGIRAMRSPNGGTSPVTTMSSPTTRNAPTAAAHPPSTAPVVTSRAAPGVDQATVIGSLDHHASTTVPTPMRIVTAMRPLDACAALAPTADSPASTTTNELVNATSADTTPAEIG